MGNLGDVIYAQGFLDMEPRSIKELFEEGIVSLALLPEKNDFLLTEEGKELRLFNITI